MFYIISCVSNLFLLFVCLFINFFISNIARIANNYVIALQMAELHILN